MLMAMIETVIGNGKGHDEPTIDVVEIRERLDNDPAVVRARERVVAAEAEAHKYNEQVARVLSSAHPDTVKGNLPVRPMPERIVELHRVAVGDVLKAQQAAFEKHRSEVDAHLERRRQRLRGAWKAFQRDMQQLDTEERAIAALVPRGVVFRRTAVDGHVSDVERREWQRRTWPPAPSAREAKRVEVVLARISDLAVVPYRQDQSPRLNFWGSDVRNDTREGDTLWVNYTTSHFSSRSTVS